MTILFQGDSVTDCSRDRDDPNSLGGGYPFYVSQAMPGVKVLNRGISGHRAKDLAARWQEDCLALNPDVVSIMIGINDVWRRYDDNDPTSDAAFEASYADALFSEAVEARGLPPGHYAEDGVHPTEAGHRLLAEAISKL